MSLPYYQEDESLLQLCYMDSMQDFHPATVNWFERNFAAATPAQRQAWPSIKQQQHTLIAAPTGSGKTLAAFLAVIDALVWQVHRGGDLFGRLPEHTQIVYVSPLKALSNDIERNLQAPLQGIATELKLLTGAELPIRTMVRTGDTPQAVRALMRRQPPHILVTTPESLCILLTSDSGRAMLSHVGTLIVDEIHALATNKRGAHLALSMERLQRLTSQTLMRVGLSATQRPIETVAKYLVGNRDQACNVVDVGHARERDLRIEMMTAPLAAVMANDEWSEVYDRVTELIVAHRTTLIFVNTRRLCERAAKALAERLVTQGLAADLVTAHHGSLAREHRLDAEQRLKQGRLRGLVATASLELGIDIGDIDLVCQIGSPRGISSLLQRVGRARHSVGGIPKGRLVPTSRDDLIECIALLRAIRQGELDHIAIPPLPLDVLAQQIVAEVSGAGEVSEADLHAAFARAWPYRKLSARQFGAVAHMLWEGFATARGQRASLLHRDVVNNMLRPRRGAKLTVVMNSGAIPDHFDYEVKLQPEGIFIGTLNEDFAFESLPGDIFQLGNSSYRVLRTETNTVHVEDAKGQPPNIPFWFGEAPGRSAQTSAAVCTLRTEVEQGLERLGRAAMTAQLAQEPGVGPIAAAQATEYLGAGLAALGRLPQQDVIVFERFFDEVGDQHLVIHSPYGSRLNRAWGLALRKRFCRRFNFELQAAALEDCIVLSLGSIHSFALEEVMGYLKAATVREVLTQAVLDAPVFAARWRWNTNVSLAVKRIRNGKRVAPQFQRSDAEDLLAVVFPDQLACQENLAGPREIPDHPLVQQTLQDCLHDYMDIEGLERLLKRYEQGKIEVLTRDLSAPSPLAQEVLTAKPYAFLDAAPAEERRTRAVNVHRFTTAEEHACLAVLDPQAIDKVCAQAWPKVAGVDELHDALLGMGLLEDKRAQDCAWGDWLDTLRNTGRAAVFDVMPGQRRYVARERLHLALGLYGASKQHCSLPPLEAETKDSHAALVQLLRARLQISGPVTIPELVDLFCLARADLEAALLSLQAEGYAMQGRYRVSITANQWCERGLLARMHRYTLQRLREQIQPVTQAQHQRFLVRWQKCSPDSEQGEGIEALAGILAQLEGLAAPAAAWEHDILPARIRRFAPSDLDQLCATGRFIWLRLSPPMAPRETALPPALQNTLNKRRSMAPLRTTPITFIARANLKHWRVFGVGRRQPSPSAQCVLDCLQHSGASFIDELAEDLQIAATMVETGLAELVALGQVSCDSFAGLRHLIAPQAARNKSRNLLHAGRWFKLRSVFRNQPSDEVTQLTQREAAEHIVRILLLRYGVVFRSVLADEQHLPPWRELLYVLRRLEAQGEVRGGRFIDGISGEQFAYTAAVELLRAKHLQDQPMKKSS